jgi:predicted O-methyltransferase YrrM
MFHMSGRQPVNNPFVYRLLSGAAYRLQARFEKSARRLNRFVINKHLQQNGVGHARSITTYTTERELDTLFQLAASCSRGATVLEIGSYLGASCCFLATGLRHVHGRLLCVDTWQNETMPEGTRDTFSEFLMNTHGVSQRVTVIRKASSDLAPSDIPAALELIFIDGDHAYHAARDDFELVQRFLAPGGTIAFHDFGNPDYPGVTRVVGEALASGNWVLGGLCETVAWIRPFQQHLQE